MDRKVALGDSLAAPILRATKRPRPPLGPKTFSLVLPRTIDFRFGSIASRRASARHVGSTPTTGPAGQGRESCGPIADSRIAKDPSPSPKRHAIQPEKEWPNERTVKLSDERSTLMMVTRGLRIGYFWYLFFNSSVMLEYPASHRPSTAGQPPLISE